MTSRRPSLAKQRRRTARPRCATRASGCRWPAISPSQGSDEGWWRNVSGPSARTVGEIAADAVGQVGIVIAGDPDPVAAALEQGERRTIAAAHARRSMTVMKAVAQRDDKTRHIALDQARQPRQRRRRIVRRQQHAALGEGRAFFQMQIGDDQQSFVRPVQRAGRIGDEHRTGESDSGILLWIPAGAGMSGRSATPHCIASFTNSVRRFGEERIGRLAVNRLAPDLQHDRHGERRHVVERFMDDSPPDAREHIGEAAHVEEAGRGVGAGGAQTARDRAGGCAARHRPGRSRS